MRHIFRNLCLSATLSAILQVWTAEAVKGAAPHQPGHCVHHLLPAPLPCWREGGPPHAGQRCQELSGRRRAWRLLPHAPPRLQEARREWQQGI